MVGGTTEQVDCSPGAQVWPLVVSDTTRGPSLEFQSEPSPSETRRSAFAPQGTPGKASGVRHCHSQGLSVLNPFAVSALPGRSLAGLC